MRAGTRIPQRHDAQLQSGNIPHLGIETMQSARLAEYLQTRPHVEMIGIPQNDFGVDVRFKFTLVNRLHAQVIEAALVAEPFTATGLETRVAFREEIVLIAPAELSSKARLACRAWIASPVSGTIAVMK